MPASEIYGLYRDGRAFDRMYTDRGQIVEFSLARAREANGPVLELGCGTGAICIPLAEAGFDVTGIDTAPAMLAVAREKASAAGVAATWIEADMRDLELGRKFDLILLAANAICHLLDPESIEACLQCVRAHLTPTGHFVIVVFVPDPAKLLPESTERELFAEYEDPDTGGTVAITTTYRYEFDTQIKRVTLYTRVPDAEEEIVSTIDMRMYFPQELDALLRYNGFHIVSKWGDHSGRPFDADSAFQIVTCTSR